MNLEKIFQSYNIELKKGDEYRHPIDIIEDMYLRLNIQEYRSLMELISQTETREGFIFDSARNRPYR